MTKAILAGKRNAVVYFSDGTFIRGNISRRDAKEMKKLYDLAPPDLRSFVGSLCAGYIREKGGTVISEISASSVTCKGRSANIYIIDEVGRWEK